MKKFNQAFTNRLAMPKSKPNTTSSMLKKFFKKVLALWKLFLYNKKAVTR